MTGAFARALRREMVMFHRDQHKDVARANLRGLFADASYRCWVCGYFPQPRVKPGERPEPMG